MLVGPEPHRDDALALVFRMGNRDQAILTDARGERRRLGEQLVPRRKGPAVHLKSYTQHGSSPWAVQSTSATLASRIVYRNSSGSVALSTSRPLTRTIVRV